MNKIESSSSQQQFRRLYSYKEERIKSSKKLELNMTLANQHDIEELETTIKDKLSRRMSLSSTSNDTNRASVTELQAPPAKRA